MELVPAPKAGETIKLAQTIIRACKPGNYGAIDSPVEMFVDWSPRDPFILHGWTIGTWIKAAKRDTFYPAPMTKLVAETREWWDVSDPDWDAEYNELRRSDWFVYYPLVSIRRYGQEWS